MKNKVFGVVFLCVFGMSGSAFAGDGDLLFEQNYLLKADVDYQTGLFKVFGAPALASRIHLLQSGSPLCDIRVFKVEYVTGKTDAVKTAAAAAATGAVYEIPEGQIYGINIHFYQAKWNNVTCALSAYVGDGDFDPDPIPGEDEELVGAIAYEGGFDTEATLPLDGSHDVTGFRIAIPSFCQGVEILQAGTVRGGTFYPATDLGNGAFSVGLLGGHQPSAIKLAVNGPHSMSCDLPIFVRFQ